MKECPTDLPVRCESGMCGLPTVTCRKTNAVPKKARTASTTLVILGGFLAAAVLCLIVLLITHFQKRKNISYK